jgi:L-rhamnose mutarotase
MIVKYENDGFDMRHVLMLDLIDDADKIARYEAWHASGAVPAAVVRSIRAADITTMEIHRLGDRLVMIMETGPGFSIAEKAAADAADPDVQAWETLMDSFQKATPFARPGEKWTPATRIFSLDEQP